MAKFKIAQNPTFTKDVQIPRVGSDPVKVPFEFKYFDRLELSEMFDRWSAARDEHGKRVVDEGLTWKEATAEEINLQVQQIKDITNSWGFEDKFTDEAITALVGTCVDATQAVLSAYQDAYQPARLGN